MDSPAPPVPSRSLRSRRPSANHNLRPIACQPLISFPYAIFPRGQGTLTSVVFTCIEFGHQVSELPLSSISISYITICCILSYHIFFLKGKLCYSAQADSLDEMLLGRFLVGIGIGVNTVLVPIYISEVIDFYYFVTGHRCYMLSNLWIFS